jgi:hypothetical protein
MLAAALLSAAHADAAGQDDAWNTFRGKIVCSEVPLAPEFGSEQAMVAALRRFGNGVMYGRDGYWRFHVVAFLDPPPQTDGLRLVATDVTPSAKATPTEVKALEVSIAPGQRMLRMNDLVVSDSMGFEHGHRYQLELVAADGPPPSTADARGKRKQDVYARGVVTLM